MEVPAGALCPISRKPERAAVVPVTETVGVNLCGKRITRRGFFAVTASSATWNHDFVLAASRDTAQV